MYTRKLLTLLLFFLTFLPAMGQQETDTISIFRFASHDDMFYIPWKGNGTQLSNLLNLMRKYKSDILTGKASLFVDGYCTSEITLVKNLELAKIRSNRVKTQLILRGGMSEDDFITHNHAEPYGDLQHVVVVRLHLSEQEEDVELVRQPEPVRQVVDRPFTPEENTQGVFAENTKVSQALPAERRDNFYLRANLLQWAMLTPDIGMEWRMKNHWGVLLNGAWTSWRWEHKNRRYAFWKISPEVRYYLGKKYNVFLGVMYHMGDFNYKLGKTGCQGSYRGGGFTGGYQLDLNRSLALDFHAAVGYTYAEYDKYALVDRVYVYTDNKSKNCLGINQLGITLIWKLIK